MDEYKAVEQKDSLFVSKERKMVVKIAEDICKITSYSTLFSAAKKLYKAIADYLLMKKKELSGGVKENENNTNQKIKKWENKHKNDKKGWGAIITTGENLFSTSEVLRKQDIQSLGNWIMKLVLVDSKWTSFPANKLRKSAAALLAARVLFLIKAIKLYIPRCEGYVKEMENKIDFKKLEPLVATEFNTLKQKYEKILKNIQTYDDIDDKVKTGWLESRNAILEYIAKEFGLEIDFYKLTIKSLKTPNPLA